MILVPQSDWPPPQVHSDPLALLQRGPPPTKRRKLLQAPREPRKRSTGLVLPDKSACSVGEAVIKLSRGPKAWVQFQLPPVIEALDSNV